MFRKIDSGRVTAILVSWFILFLIYQTFLLLVKLV